MQVSEPLEYNYDPQDGDVPEFGREPEEPGYNVHDAILAVYQEVGVVLKDGTNAYHNYKYTSEAEAVRALRPAMVKHSLVMEPREFKLIHSDPQNGNVYVESVIDFRHIPSRSVHSVTMLSAGNDRSSKGLTGDKAVYKAITGATKYALLKTFMIETSDDPEVATEAELAQQQPQVWHPVPQNAEAARAQQAPQQPLATSPQVTDIGIIVSEISADIAAAKTFPDLKLIYEKHATAMAQIWPVNKTAYEVLTNRFTDRKNILEQLRTA